MSEHPELLRRLRSGHHNSDLVTVGGVTHDGRCLVAADAITAQAADIERLTQQCAALQSAINCRWTDRADDLSTEIDRTHPFKVKDFVRWNRAQVLVSNRHSKGALIALVAYLLHEVAEVARLREAMTDLVEEVEEYELGDPDTLRRARAALGGQP